MYVLSKGLSARPDSTRACGLCPMKVRVAGFKSAVAVLWPRGHRSLMCGLPLPSSLGTISVLLSGAVGSLCDGCHVPCAFIAMWSCSCQCRGSLGPEHHDRLMSSRQRGCGAQVRHWESPKCLVCVWLRHSGWSRVVSSSILDTYPACSFRRSRRQRGAGSSERTRAMRPRPPKSLRARQLPPRPLR